MPKMKIEIVFVEKPDIAPGTGLYDYLGREIAAVWEVFD